MIFKKNIKREIVKLQTKMAKGSKTWWKEVKKLIKAIKKYDEENLKKQHWNQVRKMLKENKKMIKENDTSVSLYIFNIFQKNNKEKKKKLVDAWRSMDVTNAFL